MFFCYKLPSGKFIAFKITAIVTFNVSYIFFTYKQKKNPS